MLGSRGEKCGEMVITLPRIDQNLLGMLYAHLSVVNKMREVVIEENFLNCFDTSSGFH